MVKFAGQSYFNEDGSRTDGAGDGAAAAARAGRRRHRRRAALRARVREPVPREDPRPRRVPGDGAGLQHLARRGYCALAPDRLIGNALMPITRHRRRDRRARARARDGLQVGAARAAPRTAAAARSPKTTAFWEKALELDMALSPHMSFGGAINIGGPRHDTSQWPAEAGMTQHARGRAGATRWRSSSCTARSTASPSCSSTSPRSTPRSSRRALYYMDRDYLEYNSWFQLELPKMPSEYMKDHGALRHGARAARGADRRRSCPSDMPLELFWWGSDFPHSVGTFPRSQEYIEETFADLDDELRHTLLVGNAADAPPPRPRRRHHRDAGRRVASRIRRVQSKGEPWTGRTTGLVAEEGGDLGRELVDGPLAVAADELAAASSRPSGRPCRGRRAAPVRSTGTARRREVRHER